MVLNSMRMMITDAFDFQETLIGADPLLESFGNAKTKQNPNPSYFGKLLKFMYEPAPDGVPITTYSLERSRVTYQEQGENNYRIFYQLVTSPNNKIHNALGLKQAGLLFNYLNNTFTKKEHDKFGYRDLRIALQMTNLGVHSLDWFQVGAAVLHLGNIEFEEESANEGRIAKIKNLRKHQQISQTRATVNQSSKKSRSALAINRLRGKGDSFSSFTTRDAVRSGTSSVRNNSKKDKNLDC